MAQEYPHLLRAEADLWRAFLALYGRDWEGFRYDVHVGEGLPPDPAWPENIQRMATRLTQRRIDAVGFQAGVPTIFEVSPRGGRTTYGALVLYARLYRRTFAYTGPLVLAAVVARIDRDLLTEMLAEGIRVFAVPLEPGRPVEMTRGAP